MEGNGLNLVTWRKTQEKQEPPRSCEFAHKETNECRLKVIGEHKEIKNERQYNTKVDENEDNKKWKNPSDEGN